GGRAMVHADRVAGGGHRSAQRPPRVLAPRSPRNPHRAGRDGARVRNRRAAAGAPAAVLRSARHGALHAGHAREGPAIVERDPHRGTSDCGTDDQMNGFQWIALTALAAAIASELVPRRHRALSTPLRALRVAIFAIAAVAIARPDGVTRIA